MASHDGHRDRVRDKIVAGGGSYFHDHEMLEYILYAFIPRRDTNPIAHELMESFGSFSAVLDADYERLMAVKGMTRNAAIFISAMPDINRRYQLKNTNVKQIKLGNYKEVHEYLLARMGSLTKEEIHVLCKNSAGYLSHVEVLAKGSINQVNLFCRELVDIAIKHKAVGIIMVHNHPTKVCTPSQSDINTTSQAAVALSAAGIRLDDHIIVAGNETYSFRLKGLLDNITNGSVTIKYKEGQIADYYQ